MEKSKGKDRGIVYFLIAITCVLAVVVLVVLFLIQGTTTISGSGDTDTTLSISCVGKDVPYPFFKFDNATKKFVKVNIVLNNNKKLDTISFIYSLDYESKEDVEVSQVENRAALNKSFSEGGLGTDSFDAHFANLGNTMQMTLYAEAKKLNGISAKYFLINGSHDFTMDTLTKNYNNQGFDCVVTNKS